MEAQLKHGLLEVCVLTSLYKEDSGAAAETSSYLKDGCGKSGICNRV